jgi:hypothetical protein
MTQIEKKTERRRRQRHNMNRVYNMKNTDLDSKLQIWLLFGLELIGKKIDAKVIKMTQKIVKYPKYNGNILAGMKWTKTK